VPRNRKSSERELVIRPLTPSRWKDLEELFGERGACGGCWCMWWRIKRSEFEKQKGEGNKKAFKALVDSGTRPGLLAYREREPVGWCAVEPRSNYPALQRSRILKPVDEEPVWSVTCFFIKRGHRGEGVSRALIRGAIDYVGKKGGSIIEGYPVEPRKDRMPDAFAWTGIASAFRQEGFREVARRSETRPILRFAVRGG
jgi:predicted GNAT family acetyltransferase